MEMENLSRADSAMMIALLRRHNTTLYSTNNISGAVWARNESELDKSTSNADLTHEDVEQAMFLINSEMMRSVETPVQTDTVPPEPLTYFDLCSRSSNELNLIASSCNPPIKHFNSFLSYDEKIELISSWFGLKETVPNSDYDDEECAAANRRS